MNATEPSASTTDLNQAARQSLQRKPARFGLLGYPLGHSLSPQIHDRLMQLAGIDGTYELVPTPAESLDAQLKILLRDFSGFNITLPYKQQIQTVLDRIDPEAARIGSVNTVAHQPAIASHLTGQTPNRLEAVGFNTDLAGFLADAPPMTGRRILILGAGGVSRTLAFAAGQSQARFIRFLVRHPDKAQPLVAALTAQFPDMMIDTCQDFRDCFDPVHPTSPEDRWVLLNGTPVGMWPKTGELPVDLGILDHVQAVYDTLYNPLATRLVLAARRRGIPASGGLSMLIHQALSAQKIWHPTGRFPAHAAQIIQSELSAEIYRHSPLTLILTGFMGSGKSRIGRELSIRIGWPLIDLDQLIVEQTGRSIPAIFAESGEAAFRALECQLLSEVLQNRRCQILSTGGGALLSESALATVRAHPSLVIYLDASLETINQRVGDGQGRPLLAGRDADARASLYQSRRPLYDQLADYVVDANQPLETKLMTIIQTFGLGGD